MVYSWGWRGRHHFIMPNLGLLVVSTPFDHDFEYNPQDIHTFPLNQGEQLEGYHEFFRILMRAVKDQTVKDPGPWSGGGNGMEGFDHEQFIEPEHNTAFGPAPESKGLVFAGQDVLNTVTAPNGGPAVPLH